MIRDSIFIAYDCILLPITVSGCCKRCPTGCAARQPSREHLAQSYSGSTRLRLDGKGTRGIDAPVGTSACDASSSVPGPRRSDHCRLSGKATQRDKNLGLYRSSITRPVQMNARRPYTLFERARRVTDRMTLAMGFRAHVNFDDFVSTLEMVDHVCPDQV